MASYLLIGGVRSGKSAWAVRYAQKYKRKLFVATAEPCDDDMKARIHKHQEERGEGWTTDEAGRDILRALRQAVGRFDCVVVDCLTVWTALVMERELDGGAILNEWVAPILECVESFPGDLLFVTNEVGAGVHPESELGRRYRDLLGTINQGFARTCDCVQWFVAGIPTTIKNEIPLRSKQPETLNRDSTRETLEKMERSRQDWIDSAWNRLDRLTKPPRSMGRVEEIAALLCGIQRTDSPITRPRSVIVFAGDHGVCEEGISAFPQSVTGEMMKNMAGGGAAVSVLSNLHGVDLCVIDVGSVLSVDCVRTGVERCVVRAGTRNMTKEPAMTVEETERAMEIGRDAVRREISRGARLVIFGEMGIGNTTPASAICAAVLSCPAGDVVGRGTGVDDEGLQRKISVVEKAVNLHGERLSDPRSILACLGGFEIAAMAGGMLESAQNNIPVLLDGFIVASAALVASCINPNIRDVFIAAHASVEPGCRRILKRLKLDPILDLNMRLGEASGALTALPVLDAAVALFNEMATFESAGVSSQSPS